MAIPFKTEEVDQQSSQQQHLYQDVLIALQLLQVLEAARLQTDPSDTNDNPIDTNETLSEVTPIIDQQMHNASVNYPNSDFRPHQSLMVEQNLFRNRQRSPDTRSLNRQRSPDNRSLNRQLSPDTRSLNRQLSPDTRSYTRQLSSNQRQTYPNNTESNSQMSSIHRQSKHQLISQGLSELEPKNLPTHSRLSDNDSRSLNMPCCSSCRCDDQSKNTGQRYSERVDSLPDLEINQRIPDEIQINNLPDLIPEQLKLNQMPDLVQSTKSRNTTKKKAKSKFRLNVFDEQRFELDTDASRSSCQQDFARIGRDLRSIAENFRCHTQPNLQHSYPNQNNHHHQHIDHLDGQPYQPLQHFYEHHDQHHHHNHHNHHNHHDHHDHHNHHDQLDHPDGQYHHAQGQPAPQINLMNALVDAGIISVIRSVVGTVNPGSGGQYRGLVRSPCKFGLLIAGCLVINWIRKRF